MDCSTATTKQLELLNSIHDFVRRSKELDVDLIDPSILKIRQRVDGHAIFLDAGRLQDILMRTDADGRSFVQVNFHDGSKILITERLIGFKPVVRRNGANAAGAAAASNKLPRVVTTPDLMSVLEALEDAADSADRDLTVLRELFDSIVCGAERVGFDVTKEKAWLLPYLGATPGYRANA